MKERGREEQGGGGADGENSDLNILFTSSQLEGGKTAFLLEYFPQSSPVLVVCYIV